MAANVMFTWATCMVWLELRSHILHCLSVDAVNTFVPSYKKQEHPESDYKLPIVSVLQRDLYLKLF